MRSSPSFTGEKQGPFRLSAYDCSTFFLKDRHGQNPNCAGQCPGAPRDVFPHENEDYPKRAFRRSWGVLSARLPQDGDVNLHQDIFFRRARHLDLCRDRNNRCLNKRRLLHSLSSLNMYYVGRVHRLESALVVSPVVVPPVGLSATAAR